MIDRYTRERAREIWSDETYYRYWTEVEIAVLRAKYNQGLINVAVPNNLLDFIEIRPAKIAKNEATCKHNVIAYLQDVSPQFSPELRPYLHGLMTSNDVIDTAQALQLVASVNLLLDDLAILMEVVKERALFHKYTAMIGRTHGIHAEPITFGVKLALWYEELKRDRERLERLKELVAVGKISGAVGLYTLPPEIEAEALKLLGLRPILSNQIIPRDIHADYTATLAIIAGTLEKFGINIRLLQRTETAEVQEFFDPNQKGSSAMPHKRNPIGSENVSGLCRLMRGYALAAMENQMNTDERDISNSAPERIFLPDSTILLDYMLNRLAGIIKKLIVHPEKMLKNLNLTKGLIYSQEVQNLVAQKSGLARLEAYELVYDIAQRCLDKRADFFKALRRNRKIMKHITEAELQSCFSLDNKLKYVN